MTPIVKYTRPSPNDRAWLYDFVYKGRLSIFVVFFLWLAFLVQPIHQAMAAEPVAETVSEEPSVAEEVKPHSDSAENLETVNEPIEEESTEEVVTEETESSADTTESVAETEMINETSSNTEETGTSTDPVIGDTGSVDEQAEEVVATSTDDVTGGTQPDEGDETPKIHTDSETSESVDENISIDELPTSDTQTIVTEQNYYQFSRQACVAVGGGAYHCTVNDNDGVDSDSVVYADRGPSGNMEIYLKTSRGDVKQITDNDVEDTAPHYDPDSMQIVWQRLSNDRQQIILYDINEDKEAQLTFSRTNNMEPKVAKDGVVWQAWDNNDWEIIFFDGNFTTQITDNNDQDVAPVIEDEYILWTVLGKSTQEAKVYSLKSAQTRTIVGHDGGAIENPRFVLVYDTKYENGDVITQGFDPLTGMSAPISSQPAPEPIDIPMSDPIGEIRALIQNKSSQEDEFDAGNVDDDGGLASSTLDVSQPNASSTDTLNLKDQAPDSQDMLTLGTTTPEIINFELTDYDLVLSPIDFSALEATSTSASSTQQ